MSTAVRPREGRRGVGSVLSGVAVAVGCVLLLGGFSWGALLYRPYAVPTDSMAPTVEAGDRVLARRIDGGEVRRGDVVVFTDAEWGYLPIVKRVVGVGGDEVACCDERGRLTVNGTAVEEPYLRDEPAASPGEFEVAVPEGRLFLLGDRRSTSQDSRMHGADGDSGAVAQEAVDARVEATLWPASHAGMVAQAASFRGLPGGIAGQGPLPVITAAVVAGTVLIFGGAAYGPVARRVARRRSRIGV